MYDIITVTQLHQQLSSLSIMTLELTSEVVRALYRHHWQTKRQAESLQESECEKLRLRRGSPLVCE